MRIGIIPGVKLVLVLCCAVLISGACALGADDDTVRGAAIETVPSTTSPDDRTTAAPTTESPTTTEPTTTTTTTADGASPVTGGIPGKETSTAMNINDNYLLGVNGEECDAAWVVLIRGVDLSSLSENDPAAAYIEAFTSSIAAAQGLVTAGSPPMKAQAEGAIEFFDGLLSRITPETPVAEVRVAANEWATRDGVNAGTVLFAIEEACPMIVQNAVAPPAIFQV